MQRLMVLLLLVPCLNSFINICSGNEISTSVTEKTKLDCKENGKSLVIKGDQIKFSEFTGTLNHICPEMKSLSILATTMVTIDVNLRAPGLGRMFVSAPTWNIINTRKIDLDGAEHTVIHPPTQPNKNNQTSGAGIHGKAGLAGKPGGNFIGIGDKFINGKSLTISVNGGDGQSGGDGQDGGDGEEGVYAVKEKLSLDCFIPTCHLAIPIFGLAKTEISTMSSTGSLHTFKCDGSDIETEWLLVYATRYCNFIIKGEKGKPSGDGGNGGAGGSPGNPGNIKLKGLGGETNIITEKRLGKAGKDGNVGQPGKPGSGKNARYNISSTIDSHTTPKVTYENHNIKNGVEGKVNSARNRSDLPIPIDFSEVASLVVEYKGQLLASLNLSDTTDFRVQFYYKLEKDRDLRSMFDTLALVKELEMLESQFHKLHTRINFLPLYQSLLNRTDEYAKQPNRRPKKPADDKKVLTYLYTTILGREYNLQDRSESNLIVDIKSYLESTKISIQKYKAASKVNTIDEYRKEYEVSLENKIEEADKLINNVIIPELKKILNENRKNVDAVIDSIMRLEKQTEDNIQEMRKQRDELQSKLVLSLICDFFTMAAGFLEVIPGYGMVAARVTKAVVGVTEAVFDLNTVPTPPTPVELPPGSKTTNEMVQDLRTKSKKEVSDLIEISIKTFSKYPGEFDGILAEIDGIKQRLAKATDLGVISKLREELSQILQRNLDTSSNMQTLTHFSPPLFWVRDSNYDVKKKKGVKPAKPITKKDKNMLVEIVKYACDSSAILGFLTKSIGRIDNINKLGEAIKEQTKVLEKLGEYKKSVRNEMGPALEMMSGDVLNVAKSLGGESQASLDVNKWQLQSKLRNMNLNVQSMVKGLNVSDLFTNTFRKIEDALNTLVNVYDRIQSYQQEKKLANYIANVNSADSNSIKVEDPKLQSAINYLELILNCNIVIQQYQIAVDSFKQYVFPLAHLFLKELVLPSYLDYGKDLGSLVIKAETQISHIQTKLNEYRNTAKRYHAYVGSGQFNSKFRSTKPFFVWDKNTYKDMISALFSGESVTAYTDVRKSLPRYDAIKFTEIEINFKASDETTQTILTNVLKDFNIEAHHMGNSYYRSKDQIFLLTSGELDFSYGLEKDSRGQLIHTNEVIEQVKNGDAMLSPYATWKLQLKHISEDNPQAFDVLKQYARLVDIELIGRGHYVNKAKLDIDIKIEQYYTPVNTTDILD